MAPAAEKMPGNLGNIEFKDANFPVLSNVTGGVHEASKIPARMVEQITGSVQWTRCVETLKSAEIEQLVECGPGNVLTGLAKRIDKSFALMNISGVNDLDSISE